MSQIIAYTAEEKEILKQLIIKYPVIEEKKTDATSIKRKTDAWINVMNEFNAHSSNTKVCFTKIIYISIRNALEFRFYV